MVLLAALDQLGGRVAPRLEGLFQDAAFRFRWRYGTRPRCDPRLVPVRIERDSIARYGRWPWPRGRHAEILGTHWAELKPRGAIFDVLFRGRSSEEQDQAFEAGLRRMERVGLAAVVSMTRDEGKAASLAGAEGDLAAAAAHLQPVRPGFPPPREKVRRLTPPLGRFSQAAHALGHIRSSPDLDGVHRRFHPFVVVDDKVLPSLALVGACMAWGVPVENAQVEGRYLVIRAGGELQEDLSFRLRPDGSILINWAAPYGRGFAPVKAAELADPVNDSLRERAADKLWLLGVAGLDLDQGHAPLNDHEVPLFETHLHAMNTLLTGEAITDLTGLVWILLAMAALAALPALAVGLSPVAAAVAGALPMVLFVVLALLAFGYGSVLLPMAHPLVFGFGAYVGLLAYLVFVQEKARLMARERFSRFFSSEVVERILADPEASVLGGRRKELTILFSDIKGFTSTSERVDPDVLREFLRAYFDAMVHIVFEHRGTVDKFMGDGLMAFWGDPIELEDHAAQAVAAAREMQRVVVGIAEEWEDRLGERFQIRVGINTGMVSVGNMGGTQRMEYTVLGRAVNLTQRLEANADPGGILVGERTRSLLPDDVPVGPKREIQAKGIDEPVPVYPVEV
jgi:adenylate cyclase